MQDSLKSPTKRAVRNEMEGFLLGRFLYIYGKERQTSNRPDRIAR